MDVYCDDKVPNPQVLIAYPAYTPERMDSPLGARYAWEFAKAASEAAAWIGPVAAGVDDFRATHQPVSARVTFRLEVFAAGPAQHAMPLLTVRDLYVMVKDVKGA
ncbi:hypothetical protein ACFQ6N_12725 [Kitasatospora sp. NPDC056446]|uniref:hypothetical protein n=1 Tax=Kitasatospora sp. NPDC056446 TaxID=3345819 RepID=UPI0036C7AC86